MPRYDYRCKANGLIVEVTHPMSITIKTWGELCVYAGLEQNELPAQEPVERIITSAPSVKKSTSNAELKNMGFTKLKKREDGVYENMTRTDSESRYMQAGDPKTMPPLHNKISD